jgi:hypothetical protein
MSKDEERMEVAAGLASEHDSGVLAAALFCRLKLDGEETFAACIAALVEARATAAEADLADATRLSNEALVALGGAIVRLSEAEARLR